VERLHSANKDNTTDGHLIRKGSSLQKFVMTEIFCSAPLPHPLWEHYYAKALNQHYDSLERLSTYKDGGLEEERLFLSNDHQLCCLYLHYECSLRPVFDGEVLYPDIPTYSH
jgi:hypothetical protein